MGILTRTMPHLLLLVLIAALTGCTHEATLVREGAQDGLVSYAFQSDSEILSSSGRRDAIQVMAEKCPKGTHIVREGEIPKVSKAADRAWRGQMGPERLWGIQFTCE